MSLRQTQKDHNEWVQHNFGTRPSHVEDQYIVRTLEVIRATGCAASLVLKADQNIKTSIRGLGLIPLTRKIAKEKLDALADLPQVETMQPMTAARSAAQAIIGAQEELGEIAEAYQNNNRAACVDAVADICIYLLHFCNVAGIDFEHAIQSTISEVHMRDWVRFPKDGRTE
jgi:NTP pyrophosphatase (non-canonical NTP hydrolase)